MKPLRLTDLPQEIRQELKSARRNRGWSQEELGKRLGLPQMYISQIENGKTMPRFNTLLDYARVLDYDLLIVPRSLVPMVLALSRDQKKETKELGLYTEDMGIETPGEDTHHDEI